MGSFFVYILKSGSCLMLFYLFYKLLLSRETFHRFNRIALLCLSALAVALPFIRYSSPGPVKNLIASDLMDTVRVTMEMPEIGLQQTNSPDLIYIVLGIYLAGVLFFLLRTLWSFAVLFRLFRSGRTCRQDRMRVIVTYKAIAPFSWMNRIVLSQTDWEENRKEIITHETGHIRCGHSWDLLLAQLCVIFHWFNPAVWLLKQELQTIHEYEADEYVLRKGIDAKNYQLLLIKKAVGSQRFTSMANSFNHSKLKKRITMMLKGKSNPWARMKYLYVLPVSIFVTTAFARPEVSGKFEKISAVKISEIIHTNEIPQDKNGQIRVEGMRLEQGKEPLLILNGEELPYRYMDMIDPEQIVSIDVLKDETSIKEYGEKGINGVILVTTKEIQKKSPELDPENPPVVYIDGKESTKEEMNNLDFEQIESISVIKAPSSIDLYGEKGKNGVILVTTKDQKPDTRQPAISVQMISDGDDMTVSITGFEFEPEPDEKPLVLIDGKEIFTNELAKLDPGKMQAPEGIIRSRTILTTTKRHPR